MTGYNKNPLFVYRLNVSLIILVSSAGESFGNSYRNSLISSLQRTTKYAYGGARLVLIAVPSVWFMAYYFNRSFQQAAREKRRNNFFDSCVIYAYILVKILMIIDDSRNFRKNNDISSYIVK